jgi:hypothetical protein
MRFGDYEPQIARTRRLIELLLLARCGREGRINEGSDESDARRQLTQQSEPFRLHEIGQQRDARHVTTGSVETFHQTVADGIAAHSEDDRYCRGGAFGCMRGGVAANRCEHVHPAAHEIGGERRQFAVIAVRPAELDRNVLALAKTALLETAPKRFKQVHRVLRRPAAHEADHRHHRLLGMRHQRPRRRRAAEKRDELAPSHVGHGAFPPQPVCRTLSLPQRGRRVL